LFSQRCLDYLAGVRTFRRYHEEGYAYLITTNTERRLPVFASVALAQLVVEALVFYRDRGDYVLHAYVVSRITCIL